MVEVVGTIAVVRDHHRIDAAPARPFRCPEVGIRLDVKMEQPVAHVGRHRRGAGAVVLMIAGAGNHPGLRQPVLADAVIAD